MSWKIMDVRMLRCKILFFVHFALLLLWFQWGESTRALTNVGDDQLATKEELERNFMEWVRKVGERQHSNSAQSSSEIGQELIGGGFITVAPSGGNYDSIQAAVDSVPTHNSQRVVIQIAAGTYREQVFVPKTKPYITFQGAGSGSTIINYDATQGSSGSTQDSATVGVNSMGFVAKGITFQNSAPAPPPGAQGRQAVALRINGDMAAFYDCSFIGAQDTLYDNHGRHYFEGCYIEGSIDFVFGDGQSLYKGCQLHALSVDPGSLTAQKRSSPGESSGFSFVGCSVTGSGLVYLGRAWGVYSRVVFAYTDIADIIIPAGWYNWGDSARDSTVFYGQYKCTGAGASESGRVGWSHELTDAEAAPFLTTSFIDGSSWL